MIPRGQRKKLIKSPPSKRQSNKCTSKSTSKNKKRKNKFNPREYLQALMELQNNNCPTNRRSKNSKRDISSALTIATPALEKTISSSKIRSKSSLSHYKKKGSVENSQHLILNVCAVITEQSNIQYTEKTARSSNNQQKQIEMLKIWASKQSNKSANKAVQIRSAIKIQRAWRNYQTYKMVVKHYEIQKKLKMNSNKNPNQQVHINIRKSDLEKTLKIKKQQKQKKKTRKDLQMNQTQKIIMERWKHNNNKNVGGEQSPIFQIMNSNISEKSNLVSLEDIKEKQAERFNEAIEIIESNSFQKSKEQLLNQLVLKFQDNKRILEEDIRKQLQSIKIQKSKQSEDESESESGRVLSQSSKQKNQDEEISSEQKSGGHLEIRQLFSDESSFKLQFDSFEAQKPEIKIFDYRLNAIKAEKNAAFTKIDDKIESGQVSIYQASQNREKISKKYDHQRKEVENNKKQYIFALSRLKRNALKSYNFAIAQSSSLTRLRKSFSAGNTVIKTFLKELQIIQLSDYNNQQKQFIDSLFENSKNNQLVNTPAKSQVSRNKDSEVSESNTDMMKQYSEQIQQSIEKYLFEEITHEIYCNQNLYTYFKGYIEQIFEFHKIEDQQIMNYLSELQNFMPNSTILLERVNQKINPTSLEILRIIRDLQFQIDEYELIIPQETFKTYRQNIQKQYLAKKALLLNKKDQTSSLIQNTVIAELAHRREKQKYDKHQKYLNFQRDLKIMYMKSVFNCLNQFLIEAKSLNAFMNGRSSIGPGQLTFAMKQYNQEYDLPKSQNLMVQVQIKLAEILKIKCSMPSFKNYADLQKYQKQIMNQIRYESMENQYKWVNYMDQVLEIWHDLSAAIINSLLNEAINDFLFFF